MPEPTSDSLNAAIGEALSIRKTFCCPSCGGAYFGSFIGDGGAETLSCHDPRRLCVWRGAWVEVPWQRFDADWDATGELIDAMGHKGFDLALYGSSPRCRVLFLHHNIAKGSAPGMSVPSAVRDAAARALGLWPAAVVEVER